MRHRRRLHRRERKLRNKKVIIASICLICIMSVGFAAFQTNLSLTAKGTIKKTAEECFTVSDNGDGTGTITDYDKTCGSKVVIPETINNLTITKIGDTTQQNPKVFTYKEITYVKLPNTITYIGAYSFWHSGISNIVLNEGLETINLGAFESNQLSSLKLPSTIKNIKYSIISYNNISEVQGEFVYKTENGVVDYTTLISFGGGYNTVNVPNTVVTIGSYSLASYPIETINIPDSVQTINQDAVWYDFSLKTINIGSGIQIINSNAFRISADNSKSNIKTININRKENAISGSPWGATNATVNWTGTE